MSSWEASILTGQQTCLSDGTDTARRGFPFRLIRRWFASEASATLERAAAESKISLKQAAFDWTEKKTIALGELDGDHAKTTLAFRLGLC